MDSKEGKTGRLKIDYINKWRAPRKMDVPTTETERKESKLAGKEQLTKVVTTYPMFAKAGEKVTVIGDHNEVLIVKNKEGHRMGVMAVDIEIN